VCVDRQLRAAAKISSAKRAAFERSMANYQRRYGGAIPLDMEFARMLDAVADEVIGMELAPLKRGYANRVPELEEAHRRIKAQQIEAARLAIEADQYPAP
jgi:hypothetical protein